MIAAFSNPLLTLAMGGYALFAVITPLRQPAMRSRPRQANPPPFSR
jgi:hypothetical protein